MVYLNPKYLKPFSGQDDLYDKVVKKTMDGKATAPSTKETSKRILSMNY